jgi:outer membrane protein
LRQSENKGTYLFKNQQKILYTTLCILACWCLHIHAETLTLNQCIATALKNNPQVLNADGVAQAGQAGYMAARSGYLPQATLQSQAQKNGDAAVPAGTASESYSANLQLQQLLFDFGKTPARTAAGRKQWEAAALDSASIVQNIILNAALAYYAYVEAKAINSVAEESYKLAQTHLVQAQTLMTAGRGVRFDVVKAEVDCANARLAMVKTKNGVETSRLQLENAMGVKLPPAEIATDSLVFVPENISADMACSTALRQRPEMLAANSRVQAARLQAASAGYARWPVLNATGAYGYKATDLQTQWKDSWSAGLNLSLPLFTGQALQSSIELAEGNLKQSLSLELSTRQTVLLDVSQQLAALSEAQERIAISAKAAEQAELALTLAQERFALGNGGSLEVSDSEVSLANTKIVRIQALCDYARAQARLRRAMGILDIPK